MARKGVKNGKLDFVVDVDIISTLPDPVIYHILSFVQTVYAVRMSVLSRRWRRIWHSVPTLEFRDSVGFKNQEAFNVFLEQCLKHRKRATRFVADSSVTSVKFDIRYSPEQCAGLNRWFHSNAAMNDVKELDLLLQPKYSDQEDFSLPSAVLNGRSLTHLSLGRCVKISASCSVNLPCLKSLSLAEVEIDSTVLYNLVIRCRSLEKCVLYEVCCLPDCDIRISSLSLKFLEIKNSDYMDMKIEAVNLQCCVLDVCDPFRFDFSGIRAIKDLSVHNFEYDVKTFESQISELTQLENLTLELQQEFEGMEMNISNQNLKRFSLRRGSGDLKLTITTPNLDSFHYRGGVNLRMSISTGYCKVNGHFSITSWFTPTKVITFLSNINCAWKSLCLYPMDVEKLVIPKELRRIYGPPLPNLEHLKVVTDKLIRRKSVLRNSLRWLCPSLETLSIEKHPTSVVVDVYGNYV